MSDKVYVGKHADQVKSSPAFNAYSKVVVIVGEDDDGKQIVYESGDDSGLTLEVTNPWGTQQIADDILAKISGYVYQPFTASGAFVDPSAELGDGITVYGIYSVLSSQDINFNGLMKSDISAPEGDEAESELGDYQSSAMRQIERRLASTRVSLRVDINGVRAAVEDLESNVTTELSVLSGQIESRITSSEAQTLISQNLNQITLSAVGGENKSTVTISAGGVVFDTAVVEFSNIVADAIVSYSSITSPRIYSPNGHGMMMVEDDDIYGKLRFGRTSGAFAKSFSSVLFEIANGVDYAVFRSFGDTILEYSSSAQKAFSYGAWDLKYAKISNIILDSGMYGSTLPSSGKTGQLFFKI